MENPRNKSKEKSLNLQPRRPRRTVTLESSHWQNEQPLFFNHKSKNLPHRPPQHLLPVNPANPLLHPFSTRTFLDQQRLNLHRNELINEKLRIALNHHRLLRKGRRRFEFLRGVRRIELLLLIKRNRNTNRRNRLLLGGLGWKRLRLPQRLRRV